MRQSKSTFRPGRRFRALLGVLSLLSGVLTFSMVAPTPSAALDNILYTNDVDGPDDVPAQTDVSRLGFDDSHLPDYYVAQMQFDDTAYPGGNSGDGCIFFDSDDAEGFTDFAVCGSFIQNTTTMQVELQSAALYDCKGSEPNNDEGKRCGFTGGGGDGSNGIIAQDLDGDGVFESDGDGNPLPTPYDTTCSLNTTAPDPFNGVGTHNTGGEQDPVTDTQLTCLIYADELVELDGDMPTGIVVSNACSFTSPDPGSESKDCIVDPGSGFLQIVKNTTGGDATFDYTVDGAPFASITTSGGTGSTEIIPLDAREGVTLAEVVPAGWQLDSASCDNGDDPTAGLLFIEGAQTVVCTFNNSQSTGSLTLVKNVENFGESGPGYLEPADFPLTVDGDPVVTGEANDFDAGIHIIEETPQAGYLVGTWACSDGTSGVAGEVTFTVDVPAGGSVTCAITNTLDANFDLGVTKTITAVDTADDGVLNAVGDIIEYEIVATNNGNVTLNNVTVSDPLLGALTCTPTQPVSLAPGASISCSGSYAITQTDLDTNGTAEPDDVASGQLDNTATADSDDTDPVTASASEPIAQNPALAIDKVVTAVDGDPSGVADSVGDLVEYEIVVTNSGNVSLTPTVSDVLTNSGGSQPLTLSGPTESLAANGVLEPTETWTYTASYAITQEDLDAGTAINNEACASDTDPAVAEVCAEVDTPVTSNSLLGIDKTVLSVDDPGTGGDGVLNAVGEIVEYQILATNSGNTTLTNVQVTDPLLGTLDCSPALGSSLAPGESITCTGSYAVTQADFDTNGGDGDGDIDNTATADSDETDPVNDSEEVPLAPAAVMTILKQVDSIENPDGSDGGSSVDEADDVINYVITVTNDGNVTLSTVTVVDPLLGTLDCTPAQPATLAPGESMTCTGSYTVTQADIDTNGGGDGQIENTATADSDQTDEENDDANVPVVQVAAVAINKDVTSITNPGGSDGGSTIDEAGDVVAYTITVTNTGQQTLTNVQVTDPLLGTLTCDPVLDSSLAPDATMTCTGSYTVAQGDIDSNGTIEANNVAAGFLDNTATVTAAEAGPESDSAQVPLLTDPALTIEKTASSITNPDATDGGTTVDEAGDVINYSILVTNTGNQTLTTVSVTDSLLGGTLSCPDDTLDPGEDVTCTGSYTVSQGDIDAGGNIDLDDPADGDNDAVRNEACVDTDQTDGLDCDTADVPVDENPALQIVKTVSSITSTDGVPDTTVADAAGDVINYSMMVTNTGNRTLTNVQVSDPLVGDLVCDPVLGSSLLPGETMTCTGSYTVTQDDIDTNGGGDGLIENTATADSDESDPDDDDADVPVGQNPDVAITKTASDILNSNGSDGGATVDEAGDQIVYTIEVTNTGNQSLTAVVITDPLLGGVVAGPDSGDSAPLGVLDVGETWAYSATYTVTQGDIDAGGNIDLDDPADGDNDAVRNEACVDTDQTDGLDCDTEDVTVDENPELTILKEFVSITNPDDTDGGDTVDEAGDVINYKVTVTNSGNQTLTKVTVTDSLVSLDCVPADDPLSLAPGAEVVCTGSYTVLQADIDDNGDGDGDIDNTAVADSDQTDPEDSSVEVPLSQQPSAAVIKTTDVESYSAVGDVIDYTIKVVNDGNQSLSVADIEATLTDEVNGVDATGDLAGPFTDAAGTTPVGAGDTLAPGGSWYYTYSYTVVEADLDAQDSVTNVVCVDVDGDGTPSCSEVETPSAGLAIDKSVLTIDGDENGAADSAGDIIVYEVVVSNTGAIDLSPSVSDVLTQSGLSEPLAIGEPTESQGDDDVMEPTETWTYEFSYELTQADIDDGGDLDNEACAFNVDPDVAEVCDNVVTPVVQNPAVDLTKTASSITSTDGAENETTVDAVGDVINYEITVLNTGNVTLTGIVVSDPLLDGPISCPTNTLAPGESTVCAGAYTVTQDDIDAGGNIDLNDPADGDNDVFRNEACVATEQDAVDCDTEDVPVDQEPELTILKEFVSITNPDNTDGGTVADQAGDVINYQITVTNSGNQTLNNVTVVDPLVGDLVCTPDQPSVLGLGESMTCTGSYTVTQADIDTDGGGDGNIENLATGDSDETDPVDDDEVVPVDRSPAMTIEKTVVAVTDENGTDGLGVIDAAGDVVTYSILVTNTGNTTLTGVTISDPLLADLSCPPSDVLNPTDSFTCSGTYTVQQGDIDSNATEEVDNVVEGFLDNTATANSNEFGPVTDSKQVQVIQAPELTIMKDFVSITNPDNTDGGTVADEAGDVINYGITVTNSGNQTLNNVTVVDPLVGALTCTPGQPSVLAPGESMTCTGSYEVTQADIDSNGGGDGDIDNLATGDSDETDPVDDNEEVPVDRSPAMSLVKTATGIDAAGDGILNADGDIVTYTLTVSNDGNTTLTGVSVLDPLLGSVTCPSTEVAPGTTMDCTGSYTLTQADIDSDATLEPNNVVAGQLDNTATASANEVGDATDDEQVPVVRAPAMSILKEFVSITSTDGAVGETSVDAAGDVISYQITVTNEGNTTLTGVVVSDPLLDTTLDCGAFDGVLDVDESVVCSGSYEVSQADIDSNGGGDGDIDNTATADSEETDEVTDSEEVPVDYEPAIRLTKLVSRIDSTDGAVGTTSADAAGDVIVYELIVDNIGNTTLTEITVNDPLLGGAVTCPEDTLPVSGSMSCFGSYTVLQSDIDTNGDGDGNIENTATADSAETEPVQDSEMVPIVQNPQMTIEKTVTSITSTDGEIGETSVDAAGDVINYSILVTNSGNQTLNNVTVVDPLVGDLTCTPAQPAVLAPGDSMTCTGSYEVTQDDIDDNGGGDGDIDNTATADSDETDEVIDSEAVPVDYEPAMTIQKSVVSVTNDDGTDGLGVIDYADDVVGYSILVTNTGNVTLTGVAISDPLLADLSCPASDILGPGDSFTCVGTYTVQQGDIDSNATNEIDDVDPGFLDNTATANSNEFGPVSDSQQVPLIQDPQLTILKEFVSIDSTDGAASETSADAAGDVINYRITATNSGNQTLNNVTVVDSLVGDLTCTPAQPSVLAPTESMVCTGSYEVTQADIDSNGGGDGDIDNTATADSEETDEVTDSEEVPVDYEPAIRLTKLVSEIDSTDGATGETSVDAAGDVIVYELIVENIGNTTLTGITVTDPLLDSTVSCPTGTLPVNGSMSCFGSYEVQQSDIDNRGGGDDDIDNTATADSAETEPAQDSAEVPVDYEPEMTIVKTVTSITSTDGAVGETEVDYAGDIVNYSILVTNSGNVTLTNVQVTDALLGATIGCDPPQPSVLAPGSSMTCTGSYTATQDDLDDNGGGDGDIDNTAVATSDEAAEVQDDADVPVSQEPEMTIVKTVTSVTNEDGSDGGGVVDYVNDVINYSIVVTNTGNLTLNNVVVTDPLLGGTISCTPGQPSVLAPTESMTCTGSYTATQDDLDDNGGGDGDIDNTAVATSDEAADVQDDADVVVIQNPDHSLVKTFTQNPIDVGDTGNFTLVYENTGNVTLTNVQITDTVQPLLQVQDAGTISPSGAGMCDDGDGNLQTITCSVASLAPGESVTVTVDFLAVPLANELVPDNGETSGANYVFYFENGYVLYGSTHAGTATLIDPNGNESPASVEGRNQDIYFNAPVGGDGFQLHLSCSEVFIDGYGDLGPTAADDPEWRILAYEVLRFNTNGLFKDCGQVFSPFEVPNEATATAEPPAGLTLDGVSDDDTLTVLNPAPIEVTRTRTRRGDVEIQYFNTGYEEITLEIIRVEWDDQGGTVVLEDASYQDGVDLGISGGSPAQASIETIMPARSKDWLKLSFDPDGLPDGGVTVTIVTSTNATFSYTYD